MRFTDERATADALADLVILAEPAARSCVCAILGAWSICSNRPRIK